jgi:hypothetical protein
MAIVLSQVQAPVLDTPTTSAGGSLDASTTYYYCIVAVATRSSTTNHSSENCESPRSNIVEIATDGTNKTVNLSWSAVTGPETYMNYIVLRSKTKSDLEGNEGARIVIAPSGYTTSTTQSTSYTDDNSTNPESQSSAFIWYRKSGCPLIENDGYTEEAPATMETLYAADLATSLELMPSESAPDTHRLRTPVTPADSLELTLDFVVTDYSSSGSIEISGTDVMGNAVTETLTIDDNGTYTTTQTYASIDEDGIVSTGDYAFSVIQNRFGCIWSYKDNDASDTATNRFRWKICASFNVTGAFKSTLENITIIGSIRFYIDSSSSFQLGELDSNGYGKNGSNVRVATRRWFNVWANNYIYNVKIYGSSFFSCNDEMDSVYSVSHNWDTSDDFRRHANATTDIRDSAYQTGGSFNGFLLVAAPTLQRNSLYGSAQPRANSTVFDFADSKLLGGYLAFQINHDVTTKNVTVIAATHDLYFFTNNNYNQTFVNCTFTDTTYNEPYFYFREHYIADTITIKNTLSLKVQDRNGNAIEGASVVLSNEDGEVASLTTDSDGSITDTDLTFALYTLATGETTPVFGYATGNRGELTPVVDRLTVAYKSNTLTISKAGYQTKTIKLTMDRRREECETLEEAVPFITDSGNSVIWNLDKTNNQNKHKWAKV